VDVDYFDVLSDKQKLDEMLKYSDGARKVPIIVDNEKVSIGFNGRA
jgi:arsenate reductase-like glutaredoxin family protein